MSARGHLLESGFLAKPDCPTCGGRGELQPFTVVKWNGLCPCARGPWAFLRGWARHGAYAAGQTMRLLGIVALSIPHGLWPGWLPFRARNALILLAQELIERQRDTKMPPAPQDRRILVGSINDRASARDQG